MMKRIRDFLVPGERVLLEDLGHLLTLGEESLELLIPLLAEGTSEPKLTQAKTDEITDLEKKGDLIVTEIERKIATGAVSPPLIDNLLTLSERIDGILDLAHSISREVTRVQKHRRDQPTAFEDSIYTEVSKLVGLGLTAVRELRNMISKARTNPKGLSYYTEEIESLEEQADDLKDAVLDEIFASAHQLSYYVYNHLVRLTTEGDDLLDRCEDASDLVAIVVAALGL